MSLTVRRSKVQITDQMQNDAYRWLAETLEHLGHSDLVVHIGWNDRFTSRLGDAKYGREHSLIRLSTPLWPHATEVDRRETVVHEACHVVAGHENPGLRVGHGPQWKLLMMRCGIEPKRCHSVEHPSRRRTKTIAAKCGCEDPHMITPTIAGNIAMGKGYKCRACRQVIQVDPGLVSKARESLANARPNQRGLPNGIQIVRKNGRIYAKRKP